MVGWLDGWMVRKRISGVFFVIEYKSMLNNYIDMP